MNVSSRYLFLFLGLALPLLYVNCQGEIKPLPGSYESASQCIKKAEKSLFKNHTAPILPTAIQNKMRLSHNPYRDSSRQKVVNQDLKLSIMVETQCANEALNSDNSILQKIMGSKVLELSMKFQFFSYNVHSESELEELTQEIEKDPCVYMAGNDFTYNLAASSSDFNDNYITDQGHLQELKFFEAYSVFYNKEKGIQNITDNDPIIVAVVDSGIAHTHGDLDDNMWDENGYAGVNAISLGVEGQDVDRDSFDTSPNSHGTHVAGIIGARASNGIGGTGLMPYGLQLMSIRAFDSVPNSKSEIQSSTTDVVMGIQWAVDHGADIINLSLAKNVSLAEGIPGDEIFNIAVQYALSKNVLLVFAAGNSPNGQGGEELTANGFSVLPAYYGHKYEGAITVGSYDVDTLQRSDFSNYSSQLVEIGAPGRESFTVGSTAKGIFSTASPIMINQSPVDQYGRLEGTSMAAPMVTAAAALVKGLIRANTGKDPSPAEIERIIGNSAYSQGQLANAFKGGRKLDLSRLAVKVVTDYDLDIPLGNLSTLQCP